MAEGDITDWHGNKHADEWAKATAMFDVPEKWQLKVRDFLQKAKDLLAAHVSMHSLFPPPPDKWWVRANNDMDNNVLPTQPQAPEQDPGTDHQQHRFMQLMTSQAVICGRMLHHEALQ